MGFFKNLFKRKPKNEKYEMGLHKTKEQLGSLKKILSESTEINEDLFDSLEDLFIQADIGIETVLYFMDELKKEIDLKHIEDPNDLSEVIVDKMFEIYLKGDIVQSDLRVADDGLSVYLVVGVNGVGKTTTIGKLAKQMIDDKKRVLLVAGDTFRAGAIEQLKIWADRSGASFFAKEEKSDPASVIHDALVYAKANAFDVVICDTAGRLQNKVNLMAELSKMKRVIEKHVPGAPHETLLVIDATTGQNGMNQALIFKESTDVTGVILTKLDGTAKGGIVLAIRHMHDLPIKYVGLGEKIDDLVLFDIESFIYGLFKDFFER